jgi:hypothetical protein
MKVRAKTPINRPGVSDSEQMRAYAERMLVELGYGDAASRAALDPHRLRESLPPLPDMTKRIRGDREKP